MNLAISIINLAVPIIFFIFKAIGVYKMALARNLKRPKLALIPFVNTYYMGLIAGEMTIFGKKVKNMGIFALIFYAITYACNIAYYLLVIIFAGISSIFKETIFVPKMVKLSLNVINAISSISDIAAVVCTYFILCDILKQYSFRPVTIMALLAVIFGIEPFFLFYYRNKPFHDKSDYAKFIYAYNPYSQHPQVPYGQNPYNSGQGNPYDNQPKAEPFSDINSNDNSSEPFGSTNEPFSSQSNEPFTSNGEEKTNDNE